VVDGDDDEVGRFSMAAMADEKSVRRARKRTPAFAPRSRRRDDGAVARWRGWREGGMKESERLEWRESPSRPQERAGREWI